MTTDAPLVPLFAVRSIRALVIAGSALLFGLFVYCVTARFAIPIELEWMGGAMLDHVERVVQGKPLYAAPTVDWIPFIYTPLYYWISAAFARALPLETACRTASILATLASSALVWRLSRRLGATRFWAVASVGLFYGAYSLTGYWYDLERADALCVAMILTGTVLALESRRVAGALAAGVVLGLAFYAKQQALGVALFVGIGLIVAGQWRRATAYATGASLGIVPLFVWLHVTTNGWFDFYCVKMGAAHGIDPSLFTQFFVFDLSNAFALTSATAILFAWLLGDTITRAKQRRWEAATPETVTFAWALLGAFLASASSRMHGGGFLNVLIVWSTFASAAFGALASRVESMAAARGSSALVGAGIALATVCQLAHFYFDPSEATPSRHAEFDSKLLDARVRELEKSGEVLLTGRGHVTTPRHFHVIALMDVMRGGIGIPDDVVEALRSRRYAAYVVDEWPELTLEVMMGQRSPLFDLVLANYYVAERWDDRESDSIVGRHVHPTWVLKPRAHPLVGASFDELERRRTIEAGIAEERMRFAQAGRPVAPDAPTVEQVAASMGR